MNCDEFGILEVKLRWLDPPKLDFQLPPLPREGG